LLRARVHDRAGDVVDAVVVDLPLHAGGTQHHRVVGALHAEPALDRGDAHRVAAEVRAGCELDGGGGDAADLPYQVGAARGGVVGQVVTHRQAGPAGADGHGAGQV